MVLTKIGYRAVVPLTASRLKIPVWSPVLPSPLLTSRSRALPKLVNNHEDETVKRVAANAIAQIAQANGVADGIPSGEVLFQEALRYFRNGDQVRDESVANESLMWRMTGDELGYEKVPAYA